MKNHIDDSQAQKVDVLPSEAKEDMEFFIENKSSCSNIKLKSEKNSNSDSQEFIRLKDPVDNEDIIIRKKRSETMHYDIQRKIKSPPTLSIDNKIEICSNGTKNGEELSDLYEESPAAYKQLLFLNPIAESQIEESKMEASEYALQPKFDKSKSKSKKIENKRQESTIVLKPHKKFSLKRYDTETNKSEIVASKNIDNKTEGSRISKKLILNNEQLYNSSASKEDHDQQEPESLNNNDFINVMKCSSNSKDAINPSSVMTPFIPSENYEDDQFDSSKSPVGFGISPDNSKHSISAYNQDFSNSAEMQSPGKALGYSIVLKDINEISIKDNESKNEDSQINISISKPPKESKFKFQKQDQSEDDYSEGFD